MNPVTTRHDTMYKDIGMSRALWKACQYGRLACFILLPREENMPRPSNYQCFLEASYLLTSHSKPPLVDNRLSFKDPKIEHPNLQMAALTKGYGLPQTRSIVSPFFEIRASPDKIMFTLQEIQDTPSTMHGSSTALLGRDPWGCLQTHRGPWCFCRHYMRLVCPLCLAKALGLGGAFHSENILRRLKFSLFL